MIKNSPRCSMAKLMILASVWLAGMALAPVATVAESAGLVVVLANEYDGFLPSARRDANVIADRLETGGFNAIRLLNVTGDKIADGVQQIRDAAERAGPLRIVYASGFGMCVNDDLMLFAEDMQPEQFKSGQIGDVVVPLSIIGEAVSEGGAQTLIVFDINPNQCTQATLKAITLPANAALLVTTGIGGDVIDEVGEGGMGAFSTAFLQEFTADRTPNDIIAKVVEEIRALSDERQLPILIGEL